MRSSGLIIFYCSGACVLLRWSALRGLDGVDQQHRACHRSDAAGHRRDPTGHFAHGGEIDVAAQLAGVIAIHADVDHDRAAFDHLGAHRVAAADRGHHDVGLPRVRAQSPAWRCGTR